MEFSFATALAALTQGGRTAAVRIANGARPPAAYLFNDLLPERNEQSYFVNQATMIVRSTMAGLVGMDAPYPPGGQAEMQTMLQETAKIAITSTLTEAALRQLQALLAQLQLSGLPTVPTVQQEAVNFLQKVILQPILDTAEWLRGQALIYGEIAWTFNKKTLEVDYLVPSGNFIPAATSTEAYDKSASTFWTDLNAARRVLKNNVRIIIAHPDTLSAIAYNAANSLRVIGEDGTGGYTLQRFSGTTEQPTGDTRDVVRMVAYQEEAEILDPANPGHTIVVPFMPVGKILLVGRNTASYYRVGQGSTPDPNQNLPLGYTHIGPTTEGGGVAGTWSRLYTPEGMPMQLRGDGVRNMIPVIEQPSKIAVLTTEIGV